MEFSDPTPSHSLPVVSTQCARARSVISIIHHRFMLTTACLAYWWDCHASNNSILSTIALLALVPTCMMLTVHAKYTHTSQISFCIYTSQISFCISKRCRCNIYIKLSGYETHNKSLMQCIQQASAFITPTALLQASAFITPRAGHARYSDIDASCWLLNGSEDRKSDILFKLSNCQALTFISLQQFQFRK